MKILKLFLKCYLFIYPFLVYFLILHRQEKLCYLAIGLMLLINIPYKDKKLLFAYLSVVFFLSLILVFFQPQNIVRIFPFLMSLSFLALFCRSLGKEKSILEFYVSPFKKITDNQKIYFKKIMPLWIGFLGLNSFILFILIFAFPLHYWLVYSGFISYVLISLMIILSILVGKFQKKA